MTDSRTVDLTSPADPREQLRARVDEIRGRAQKFTVRSDNAFSQLRDLCDVVLQLLSSTTPAAPRGGGEETGDRTAWLIERNEVEGQSPTLFWHEDGEWYDDAKRATRYPTELSARNTVRAHWGLQAARVRVEEHRWCSGPDLTAPSAPQPPHAARGVEATETETATAPNAGRVGEKQRYVYRNRESNQFHDLPYMTPEDCPEWLEPFALKPLYIAKEMGEARRECARCGIEDARVLDLDTGAACHPELMHCIRALKSALSSYRPSAHHQDGIEAVEDAKTICRMLEMGDNRLMAGDGPCGGQLPELSPDEWGVVYQAAKRIAERTR
jgi:hypothetical protein